MKKNTKKREATITALAFCTWGITMLCRTSFGYFLEPLSLTAGQAGIANSLTAFFVCLMMVPLSELAARKQAYSYVLISSLLLCALSMFLLSYTVSFHAILIAKALLGIGCAPVFTLLTTLVRQASTPETYPVNAGIQANGEAILNAIIGPVFIVYALQSAGYIRTVQLLALSLLILSVFWFAGTRNPESGPDADDKAATFSRDTFALTSILKNRNLLLCALGGIFSLLACWGIYIYVPTMLTKAGGFSDSTMSYIMMLMGVFMAVLMLLLPMLANKIGNKKVTILFSLIGSLVLLSLCICPRQLFSVVLFILLGGSCSVISMFFMAIIAPDTVPAAQCALAVAFVNSASELFGSSIGPVFIGLLADRAGIAIGMLLSAAAMLLAAVTGTFLKETH